MKILIISPKLALSITIKKPLTGYSGLGTVSRVQCLEATRQSGNEEESEAGAAGDAGTPKQSRGPGPTAPAADRAPRASPNTHVFLKARRGGRARAPEVVWVIKPATCDDVRAFRYILGLHLFLPA